MKKIIIIAILSFSVYYSYGQYSTAAGVHLGIPYGLNFKQFVSLKSSVELWASISPIKDNNFRNTKVVTALYEYNIESKSASRMFANTYFILGGGTHISLCNPKKNMKEESVYRFGLDAIAGLEIQLAQAPLIIGINVKPYWDFKNPEDSPNYIHFGFMVRYIINEQL